ncbi:MAG: DUF3089 domain-containing protein [Lewinellaceae bacterium]|nr:DUF3089 domain-containing protein [Lewinellaceae bacterium]
MITRIGLLFLLAGVAMSCAVRPKDDYRSQSQPGSPDYSRLAAWASHPDLDDPADRIPDPELPDRQMTSGVDVFFIHPTTYTGDRGQNLWNAPVDDEKLNRKTDKSTILYQASLFNGAGRIFAPRYRQAHLNAYFTQDRQSANNAFDLAYSDVKSAFEYYLAHFNNGRPFIIASHSQGTTHGIRLVRELIDGKPLQQQLVAAYLVGMPVEKNAFEQIPPCGKPDQTGCFVSWRTYKKGYTPPEYIPMDDQLAVVNPLTWDTTAVEAPKALNRGAVVGKFSRVIPGVTDAQIHEGILWASKPKFPGSFLITRKNYHIGDYNLYYLNVRENAADRVAAFMKNNATAGGK